jgi:Beta-ketoacyl synthase, N-terminal domain
VHNALAGLLSIALKNTAGHTAIAAGADTFGFGLVEASACIADQPGNRVLLVYFDEALPNPYSELHGPADLGIAVALLVAAGRRRGDDLILSFEPQRGSDTPPSAHVAAFLGFLVSDRGELVAQGSRMLWRWRRAG